MKETLVALAAVVSLAGGYTWWKWRREVKSYFERIIALVQEIRDQGPPPPDDDATPTP